MGLSSINGEFVNHLVIEPVDHMAASLPEVFKIQQQPGFVEFLARQGDPDLVIVSVRLLALAFVITQVVAGGKRIFNRDFEHETSAGEVMTDDILPLCGETVEMLA